MKLVHNRFIAEVTKRTVHDTRIEIISHKGKKLGYVEVSYNDISGYRYHEHGDVLIYTGNNSVWNYYEVFVKFEEYLISHYGNKEI